MPDNSKYLGKFILSLLLVLFFSFGLWSAFSIYFDQGRTLGLWLAIGIIPGWLLHIFRMIKALNNIKLK